MNDEIKPALTAKEWVAKRYDGSKTAFLLAPDAMLRIRNSGGDVVHVQHPDFTPLIALANAALPDSDPRKITREMVTALREAADEAVGREVDIADSMDAPPRDDAPCWKLHRLADALESYLPP